MFLNKADGQIVSLPKDIKSFVKRLVSLEKHISEGETLLEGYEDVEKKPGQLTVGMGWYQWGGHDSDEESQS